MQPYDGNLILYRPNDKAISHENIDGEIIAINYRTGQYFSLRGTAAKLWQLLSTGASLAQIQAASACRTAEDCAVVDAFLTGLLADELVIAEEQAVGGGHAVLEQSESADFDPPVVERYADLEQLLLADPLHDVDDMGWPHAAPTAA